MKNQIILTALTLGAIVLGINTVQAQVAEQTTSTVASIELADVISINTGSTTVGGAVKFVYNTVEDYTADQTVKMPGSLNITSTKNFDINVKATSDKFDSSTSDQTIDLDVLTIIPIKAGTNGIGGNLKTIVLSKIDQLLVDNAELGTELLLDIEYKIPAAKSKSKQILGKPSGTYTTTVKYTATAK